MSIFMHTYMLPTYGEKPEYYHTCAHHVCVSILKKKKCVYLQYKAHLNQQNKNENYITFKL